MPIFIGGNEATELQLGMVRAGFNEVGILAKVWNTPIEGFTQGIAIGELYEALSPGGYNASDTSRPVLSGERRTFQRTGTSTYLDLGDAKSVALHTNLNLKVDTADLISSAPGKGADIIIKESGGSIEAALSGMFNIREVDRDAGFGVTDDTSVIEEALSYAKTKRLLGVYFGPGLWLADEIKWRSGMGVSGAGHGSFGKGSTAPGFGSDYRATVIQQRDGANRHFMHFDTLRDSDGYDRIGPFFMRDILLMGSNATPSGKFDGLRFQHKDQFGNANNNSCPRPTIVQANTQLQNVMIRNFSGNGRWLPALHGGYQEWQVNAFFNGGAGVYLDLSFGSVEATTLLCSDGDGNLDGNLVVYGMGSTIATSGRNVSGLTLIAPRGEQRHNPNAFATQAATGAIVGTVLTFSVGDPGGNAGIGMAVEGSGVSSGTNIIGYNSGTSEYTVNISQTVTSRSLTLRKLGTQSLIVFDTCEGGTVTMLGGVLQSTAKSIKPAGLSGGAIIMRNHTSGSGPSITCAGLIDMHVAANSLQDTSPDSLGGQLKDEVSGNVVPANVHTWTYGPNPTTVLLPSYSGGKARMLLGASSPVNVAYFNGGVLQVHGTAPGALFYDTDSSAGARGATIDVNANELHIRAISDDGSTNNIGLTAAISGGAIQYWRFHKEVRLDAGTVLKINNVSVLRDAPPRAIGWTVPTGTTQKGGYTVYADPGTSFTVSASYTQSEVSAIATRVRTLEGAVQSVSRTLAGLVDAMHSAGGSNSHGVLQT